MEPEDLAAASNQRGAWKLQHVAVLLKSPFEADGVPGRFRCGATTAALRTGKQDAPPVGAFESHGTIALALGIREADGLDALAAAKTRHLRGSSLHHAADANPTLIELRQGLTQLRERFRIEGSAEMPEPEDESRPGSPVLGEAMCLAGGYRVNEIRDRIADGWSLQHLGHGTVSPSTILAQNERSFLRGMRLRRIRPWLRSGAPRAWERSPARRRRGGAVLG